MRCKNPNCQKELPPKGSGGHRGREYCNNACKQIYYRMNHPATVSEQVTEQRLSDMEQRIAECQTEQLALMKRTIAFHDNLTILMETEKYNTVQQLHKMMEAMKTQDVHIEALEQQVQTLTELLGQQTSSPEVTTQLQELPSTISLNQFADLHGVSRNEAERLRKVGFIAGKREPGQGRRRGSVILDAGGMHDFWVQFHNHPDFRKCDTCPH